MKRCPHCGGNLFLERGEYKEVMLWCLQCSRTFPLDFNYWLGYPVKEKMKVKPEELAGATV